MLGKTTKEDKVLCKLCDCPWLYTNEVTECVLLSMLLRQLFSSLFRPLANSLYEVHTTTDSSLLLADLKPFRIRIDALTEPLSSLLVLPFFSQRTFLFTASLADCRLLPGVTFFFIVFVTFLTLDLVVRGGRPADFPAAGLGDGQMLECSGNLDGVDVVVASCIFIRFDVFRGVVVPPKGLFLGVVAGLLP